MTEKTNRAVTSGVLLATSLVAAQLHAQWTDEPSVNTQLASGLGDQVQPKFAADGDGGFFLSWFSSLGGYDVYLQRFDGDGNAMWEGDGLLVADRAFSSTEDYGLAVTPDGAAVLAYRGSGSSISAMVTRVSADGAIVWSVQANKAVGSVYAPDVTVASDGDVVVGWIGDATTKLHRLSPDGSFAWEVPVTIADGTNVAQLTNVQPGGDAGEAIVSFVTYATFTGAKRLKAQKVNADGSLAWDGNSVVFATGSLQFGNYPSFVSDGSGGGVFSWYNVSPLQCHVQRLDSDGNALYGVNGATMTASASGFQRTNPSTAFDPESGLLMVTWIEQVTNTSLYGFSAQRFDIEDGSRLWGEDGIAVGPVANHYDILGSSALVVDGAFVVAWNPESSYDVGEILAQQLDVSGNAVWDEPVAVCTVGSGHSRLTGLALGTEAVFAWQDDRSGNEDLYGQNVNLDGTLGIACPGDFNGAGLVDGADLNYLLAHWGPCSDGSDCLADINLDGKVDGADLNILLGAWGPCP